MIEGSQAIAAGLTPGSTEEAGERRDFQMVPLWGLPIAAAVLIVLVISIAGDWLWPLNFFHVAGGGLWTGVDLFVGLIVGPVLSRLSPRARIEFLTRFMPKMLLVMPVLVTITLTSGWQLARHIHALEVPYPLHWWLTASYVVVGVMAVIAVGVLTPANLAILFELKKPRPNGELIGRLARRFIYTAGVTGVMQLAILIIMTRIALW
jgi:hypothetical protein